MKPYALKKQYKDHRQRDKKMRAVQGMKKKSGRIDGKVCENRRQSKGTHQHEGTLSSSSFRITANRIEWNETPSSSILGGQQEQKENGLHHPRRSA